MNNALSKQVAGSHYKGLPIQPVEFCQRNGLGFCESSAIKYIVRHRSKNGKEDVQKAIHFLELLLELNYPEDDKQIELPLDTTPLGPLPPAITCPSCGDEHRNYTNSPGFCESCECK